MDKSEDQKLKEVLKRISEPPELYAPILHPSECVNQKHIYQSPFEGKDKLHEMRSFYMINDYHLYCKLCQHHIYLQSKLNDINSFFQAHLNSAEHVWNRKSCNWDEAKPILQWEKWLYTAFCAICNKSGIEAFIIDSMTGLHDIIGQHTSGSHHRENRKHVCRQRDEGNLARSDFFSILYIVKIPAYRYFCKVCSLEIEQEALIESHLNSENHYKEFCDLFKKEFNIKLDDNGKMLELNVMADHMKKIFALKSYSAVTHKKKLNNVKEIYYSCDSEMKFLTELQLGFSPSAIDKAYSVADEDLKKSFFCALCNEYPANMDRHLSSNSHQLRLMVFQQCSSVRPVSLLEYLPTSRTSPAPLKKYMKYKLLLQKHGLDFGIPYKPEYAHINLNSDSFDVESSYETINERIKGTEVEYLTAEKECSKNLQANTSESTERKESAIPGPKEMKEPPDGVTVSVLNKRTYKGKTEEEKPVDIIISTESLNMVEYSTVVIAIEKYLERVGAMDKSESSKSHPKEKKDKRCSCYYEEKSTLIRQLRFDSNFIMTFEVWSYLDSSSYVCVICGTGYNNQKDIFPHLKKRVHIHRYKEMKNGNLKRISPSKYSINIKERACICKRCGRSVCEIKSTDFPISLVARSISLHEKNCSKAGKCPSPVSENDGDSMAQLKKQEGMTRNVVNHEHMKKNDVKKSEQVAAKRIENCIKKPEERKTESVKSVKQEKIPNNPGNEERNEPKVEIASETKSEQYKKQKSAGLTPLEKESVTLRKLNNFIVRCGLVLTEFLCVICLENDTMDALENHLRSETHLVNETFIRIRWFVDFGFCKFCKLLLLGTTDMFRQHYTSVYHANKEGDLDQKEIRPPTLIPQTMDLLVVKGMPNMSKEEQERSLRVLLTPFGSIKQVFVRKHCSEVLFFDQRVVASVLAVGKFLTGKNTLSFFLKRVTQDLQIGMKSSDIYLLGRGNMKLFVSCLIFEANRMITSESEKEKEEKLCDSLQKVIQCVYPNCKCFKFGSRVTGLIVGSCDLDVFLDYDNAYYAEDSESPVSQSQIVKKVAAALKASKQFKNVTGIKHCRVPIVTCLHISTNIHCDISFKNGLSCENTNLIKFMISIDNRPKGVILFLKYWAKSNGIHGRPYFSSYALTMFVFFYLQQEPNPVLPTVQFLKSCYSEPEKVIGEWDCGFTTDKELIPKTKNSHSVVELIAGFFNFCNTFDFSEYIISPLTGKALPKGILRNMAKSGLPAPYDKYKSKISSENYGGRESICIMDPFDLDHNLTKGFPEISFQRFLYLCRLSSKLLMNSLQSKYFDHLYDNLRV